MGRKRQARYRTVWPCPECGSLMWLSRTGGKKAVDNLGCDKCGHYERLEEIASRQSAAVAAAFVERSVRDGPGPDAGSGTGVTG